MGIGFAVVAWGLIGLVLACVGSLILISIGTYLTRGATRGRGWLLAAFGAFPIFCFAWAGAAFAFQAVVNVVMLHRDIGIGDGFDCPLPNGYALTFVDETEIGTLYNPGGRPLWSDVRDNAVNDVRAMQLAGPYVLGAVDSQRAVHFGTNSRAVDSYFLLDTASGTRTEFKTYDALRDAASRLHIQPELVPISNLYTRYRYTWFDAFAGILLVVPPLLAAALLMRWTVRFRRDQKKAVV